MKAWKKACCVYLHIKNILYTTLWTPYLDPISDFLLHYMRCNNTKRFIVFKNGIKLKLDKTPTCTSEISYTVDFK
jgi:hypothetical protein